MKQYYLILIALISFSITQAQIVDIPDGLFKNALLNTNCVDIDGDEDGDIDADTNDDGEIQVSEAEAVLGLYVSARSISSLEGINAFVNLQALSCETNLLTTLDVSNLTNLEDLRCTNNNLTALNVSNLVNLNYLKTPDNELSTINLNGLINLTTLICNQNQFASLDLNGVPNLDNLQCGQNQLTALDLSGVSNLTELNCSSNELTSLNLSQVPNLINLSISINEFTAIDLSAVSNLNGLTCRFNQLTTLDLSPVPNLNFLSCDFNELITLDLSVVPNLLGLNCGFNELTTLDLSSLSNIRNFDCRNNQLISLFIKNGSQFPYSSSWNFETNPNMEYICVDDFELDSVLSKLEDYGYTNCVANSYCSFVPGGEFYTIEGDNKFDLDIDGCDINDAIFPNLKFNITNGSDEGTIISNALGSYLIPFQEGIHTLTPILENPDYFTVSPESISVDFPSDSSPYIQDFCITPNDEKNDLEIIVSPLVQARPGFVTNYKIVFKNKGNTILNGNLTLAFQDDLMDLVSSNPSTDNQVVNELEWNYSNLLPFESREIFFSMDLNTPTDTPPLNGDDTLEFIATINPVSGDETEDDNTFVLEQIVVNSFDPNDKTCLQGKTIEPEYVGKYVHYMIRFENTGTASAVNIVVKDEIDITKYDVSTLIPLHSSHDFVTRIKDDNIVEFIFEDINLPFDDANNDGYVVFKIKTLETLELGDTFSNDAEIYFDYNAPIITNDELTTVAENLSIAESELQNLINIYPNPVTDVINLESKTNMESISVFDVHGRQIRTQITATNQIQLDVSNLAKGVYFLNIKTESGVQTSKILKE